MLWLKSYPYLCFAGLLGLTSMARPATAEEDHSIYYGSRAGMHLTTVSKSGIGTANSVIIVKHTPKDAKAFCVEYSQDYSMACVKRTMAEVKVGDRVTADCKTWMPLGFWGSGIPTTPTRSVTISASPIPWF